jgi:AcrR family transcriptional regulator
LPFSQTDVPRAAAGRGERYQKVFSLFALPSTYFKRKFENGDWGNDASIGITRERILKTAARLFAERGYEAISIRTLAAKARVNQAAINYHFKTKDGLYREVLRAAIHALTEHQLSHAQETQAMPRERALGEFVRQQLRPLSARDDVSRYIHILNWEAVRPTANS